MWLTCAIAGERYAIPLDDTSAVIRKASVTPLLGAPDVLVGVIQLHGRMVAVVDPAVVLGLPRAPLCGDVRLIVVEHDGEPVALSVSSVDDVLDVPISALLPPPPSPDGARESLLSHVFTCRDTIAGALNVSALLACCLERRAVRGLQ